MRNLILSSVAALVLVAGCAKPPPVAAPSPPPPAKESLDERMEKCNALYDHLVDLATATFVKEQYDLGSTPSSKERVVLKARIAQSLESRGVNQRFGFHCMVLLTPAQIACETKAGSMEGIQACEPDSE